MISYQQATIRRAGGDDFAVLILDGNSFSRAITEKIYKYFGGFDKNTYLCIV